MDTMVLDQNILLPESRDTCSCVTKMRRCQRIPKLMIDKRFFRTPTWKFAGQQLLPTISISSEPTWECLSESHWLSLHQRSFWDIRVHALTRKISLLKQDSCQWFQTRTKILLSHQRLERLFSAQVRSTTILKLKDWRKERMMSPSWDWKACVHSHSRDWFLTSKTTRTPLLLGHRKSLRMLVVGCMLSQDSETLLNTWRETSQMILSPIPADQSWQQLHQDIQRPTMTLLSSLLTAPYHETCATL